MDLLKMDLMVPVRMPRSTKQQNYDNRILVRRPTPLNTDRDRTDRNKRSLEIQEVVYAMQIEIVRPLRELLRQKHLLGLESNQTETAMRMPGVEAVRQTL
jgi:hypothetical protein